MGSKTGASGSKRPLTGKGPNIKISTERVCNPQGEALRQFGLDLSTDRQSHG